MTTIPFDKMTFAEQKEWLKQQDTIDPTEEELWDEVLRGTITEDNFKDMIYEMSGHKINYYETPHNHKYLNDINHSPIIYTYIVKNKGQDKYVFEQYYKGSWRGINGKHDRMHGGEQVQGNGITRILKHTNPRLVETLRSGNLSLIERMEWLNEQDKDVYEMHHNTVMDYNNKIIPQLRVILMNWNSERPKEYRIKGVHKMKRDELLNVAKMGKYVAS